MRTTITNVSKIASELTKADSISYTRQVLRRWKDAGTLGSNLVSAQAYSLMFQ